MALLARLLYLLCDSGVRVHCTAQAPSFAGSPAYAGCFLNAAWKRFTASLTLSREPKAEARTKPSPEGPKPEPGVVTMSHSERIFAKTSQDFSPGNFTQT